MVHDESEAAGLREAARFGGADKSGHGGRPGAKELERS
jgi:hypothetical protein